MQLKIDKKIKPEDDNFTFRLEKELVRKFDEKCKEAGFGRTAVVRGFMESVVSGEIELTAK